MNKKIYNILKNNDINMDEGVCQEKCVSNLNITKK